MLLICAAAMARCCRRSDITNTAGSIIVHRTIAIALVAMLLGACSSEQLYASGRNAQRAECMKQVDGSARDRCLGDAGMSQGEYQREVDAARK